MMNEYSNVPFHHRKLLTSRSEAMALTFSFDERLWRRMSWKAVTSTTGGRAGLAIVAALIMLSPVCALVARGMASGSMSVDSDWVTAMTAVGVLVPLLVAYGVLVWTSAYCNKFIGNRVDQQVSIDEGWLTFSFREKSDYGHGDRNIVMVSLDKGYTTMEYDPDLRLITLRGSVWSTFTREFSELGPLRPSDMQRQDYWVIDNCFQPDLFQALLPYFS